MARRHYEGMFLLDSGKYASDPSGMAGKILEMLERVGAEVVSHRPWQDGKLAYPINKHRRGLHYLVYFHLDSLQMEELNRLSRLNDYLMRFMYIEPPVELFDMMAQSLLEPGDAAPSEDDEGTEEKEEKKEAKAEVAAAAE